jgi:L-malate glycosyltransferase
MRILQLITRNQLRGAEVFAAQLSDQLAERGHQVVLAFLFGDEEVLSTRPDVRQVGLGGDPFARFPVSLRAWTRLRRLVSEFRPDIVQANGADTWKYAALLRARGPYPPVIYRNISVVSMWVQSGAKRWIAGAALRRMSHIASVSEAGKRDLIEHFSLLDERISVLPVGVAIPPRASEADLASLRQSVRQDFGLPVDCPLVVHVGSFTPEKNHGDLLKAFSRVSAEISGARLLLVGGGPLRAEIEASARLAGLRRLVRFAGPRPDAAALIAGADLLALCSFREGLPGVILEAAAVGIPSISYKVGGVSEAVEHDVAGLLIEQGDWVGFAATVARALKDRSLCERLGAEVRRRVAESYALGTVTGQFERMYRSVLGHVSLAQPRLPSNHRSA